MSVWEKALAEELVYLLAHIAHAEQHLLEVAGGMNGVEPRIVTMVDRLRVERKKAGECLYRALGLATEGRGEEFRSVGESLWCTLKHLSMALVHCDECIEKLVRKLVESVERGDEAQVKTMLEEIQRLLSVRETLRNSIKSVLFELPETVKYVESVRCREDLCLEVESEVKSG